MKKLLTLGVWAGIILFTGCTGSSNSLSGVESLTDKEKISGKYTVPRIMESANYFGIDIGCTKVQNELLFKNYGKKAAELYEIEVSDLTETDIRQFFIQGWLENGMFGDKNFQSRIYKEEELKRRLSLGRYNGKLMFELLSGSKGRVFFFDNEKDCKEFTTINEKKI